jgi:tRNA G18 (ribose-2'-O)-methylase SpoU
VPRLTIERLDDPRIAVYRSLKATNETRDLDQFVVEGEKLVERLAASRFPLASVLVTDRHEPRLNIQIPDDIPKYVVPYDLVHEIVGFPFHRGVLASGFRLPPPDIDTILERASPRGRLVFCPRISNPDNVGAIARISDVFGLDAILAGPECPDPLSRRVLRVSMGSALRIPIIVHEDLGGLADHLTTVWGVELLAAVAQLGAEPFDTFPVPARWGLILGNEDEGVDAEWSSRANRVITIPMAAETASLNVSVAAGILLYRLSRG